MSKKNKHVKLRKSKKSKTKVPFTSTIASIHRQAEDRVIKSKLRALSYSNNIARVCIQIIKKAVLQVDWEIISEEENMDGEIEFVEGLLKTPNNNSPINTWRKIMSTIIEDVLVIDQGVIEKVKNAVGETVAMYNVAGKTIFPQIANDGTFKTPAYLQYVDGNPTNSEIPDATFEQDELLIFQANPLNGAATGKGSSPITQVIETIVATINAMNFNASYFTSSKIPPAIANFKNADVAELKRLKTAFQEELRNNDHATAFVNSEKMDYQMLRPSNQDMQFAEYYEKQVQVIVSIFGLSIQDVGLLNDVNKATAQVQSEISKNRGVRDMLSLIEEEINRDLIKGDLAVNNNPRFGLLEFKWMNLDKLEDRDQAEIDKIYIETGIKTVNEARADLGLEQLEEEELESAEEQGSQIQDQVDAMESRLNTVEKSAVKTLHKQAEPINLGTTTEREQFPDEERVDFTTIGDRLEQNMQNIVSTVTAKVDDATSRVKKEIKQAVRSQSPAQASQITALAPAQVTPVMLAMGTDSATFGIEQAQSEVGNPVAFDSTLVDETSQVTAQVNSEDMVNKLNTNTKNLATSAVANNMDPEQIDQGVDDTMEKFKNTTLSLAATALVMDTFNNGRNSYFKEDTRVVGLRYNAVLDSKTTEFCASLDGKVFAPNDPVISGITPPNHFNCRSFFTPVMRGDVVIFTEGTPKIVPTLPDFEDSNAFTKSVGTPISRTQVKTQEKEIDALIDQL
jgi:SPP1 gp7 family putative phage head morphogenesis protein